jgi:hypothetical protein
MRGGKGVALHDPLLAAAPQCNRSQNLFSKAKPIVRTELFIVGGAVVIALAP